MPKPKELVLITGASTGLGLALARELLKSDQYRLVLTARKESLLRFYQLGFHNEPSVLIRPLDVNDEQERQEIINECEHKLGGLDILINNAGIMLQSVTEHAAEQELYEQMSINYVGPMRMISLALPGMRRRRHGRIINVSSAAGLVGMPTMSVYCASKYALEGATESLWYETKPWNISVSLVIPGFIHSESYKNTKQTQMSHFSMENSWEPYHFHYKNMRHFICRLMRLSTTTPEKGAKKILRLMQKRRPPLRYLLSFDAWLLFILVRLLPRPLYHWIMFCTLPGARFWERHAKKVQAESFRRLLPRPNEGQKKVRSLEIK
ncbi:MAG: SDR family oxidoreductase [Bdellovibrionales bacterium]|nr:SDR family oxidoreductase [Bdellovibrionales bacterium]